MRTGHTCVGAGAGGGVLLRVLGILVVFAEREDALLGLEAVARAGEERVGM